MTEVATVNAGTLMQLDNASREAAVTAYLTSARDWLSRAVDETGPEQIAAAKAEIATAAEATKQLNLSREIQEDATEMVRRAEYALGKAIRRGQEEGVIRTNGVGGGPRSSYTRTRLGAEEYVEVPGADTDRSLPSPYDFASKDEMAGNGAGIYHMADGTSDEQFEEALIEAKEEHNLSRANVVRKIKAIKDGKSIEPARPRVDESKPRPVLGQDLNSYHPSVRKAVREQRDLLHELSITAMASSGIPERFFEFPALIEMTQAEKYIKDLRRYSQYINRIVNLVKENTA